MSPSATPYTQQEANASSCRPGDPRPHVAALLELSALGWHVTEIRPGRVEPVLWRVTIRRYDGYASITLTEADPDTALDELSRYAAVDGKEARPAASGPAAAGATASGAANVPARRRRRGREGARAAE